MVRIIDVQAIITDNASYYGYNHVCYNLSVHVAKATLVDANVTFILANTRHWTNVGVILGQNHRSWTKINPIAGWYIVVAGIGTHVTLLAAFKGDPVFNWIIFIKVIIILDIYMIYLQYCCFHSYEFGIPCKSWKPSFSFVFRQNRFRLLAYSWFTWQT